MADRRIFVDDNATAIAYNGPWTAIEQRLGLFGTLHELNEPKGVANLSVDFTGTLVNPWALTQRGNDTFGTVVTNPILYTINCLVDGNLVSTKSQPEVSLSSLGLCNLTEFLLPGMHTLEVILTFPLPNPDFSFYLDYILVIPADNQAIGAQENLLLFWDDPIIQTSIQQANAGWTNGANWAQTSTNGSQFTFQFTGISVMWFGNSTSNSPLVDSTATYTIDGGDVFSFQLVGNGQFQATPTLFNTQEYPYGNHTLHVVYQGNIKSVPLTLYSLIVQRVPTSGAPIVPTMSTTTTPTPSPTIPVVPSTISVLPPAPSSHHGLNAASIGGIVGGTAGSLLVIIALLVYLFRRRSQTGERPTSANVASSHYFNDDQQARDSFPVLRKQTDEGRSQTSAPGVLHATPLPHGIHASELEWTPLSLTSLPPYDPNMRNSPAQMRSIGGMEFNDPRKGIFQHT